MIMTTQGHNEYHNDSNKRLLIFDVLPGRLFKMGGKKKPALIHVFIKFGRVKKDILKKHTLLQFLSRFRFPVTHTCCFLHQY